MSNYKGSNRCILEFISSPDFIANTNSLIGHTGASISPNDTWMPKGLLSPTEAELFKFIYPPITPQLGKEIQRWWLEVYSSDSRTPNWDLVSTCTINDKKGILLVEAKAHELELHKQGKQIKLNASVDTVANHKKIGEAIEQANTEINKSGHGVSISRDKCYQLSNRVAHAWWLANQGIPVVLLYLGFLKAEDMRSSGYKVFDNAKQWDDCFENHAKHIGVEKIVDVPVNCGRSSFITIVRAV